MSKPHPSSILGLGTLRMSDPPLPPLNSWAWYTPDENPPFTTWARYTPDDNPPHPPFHYLS